MRPARFACRLARLVPALALLAGCTSHDPRDSRLPLSDCTLPHLATVARCATIEVPEDRAHPDGRRIGIFVAVLPARTLSPRPDPLVILAGGPGQAASALAPLAIRLSAVRRWRDIVLIDPRGAGRSSPLRCEALRPDDTLASALRADTAERARACVAELRAAGVDPARYTTEATVEDIDAARAALGYPTVNLWGGSYGTRLALAYLRRHPERVRTLVLDGVAPPSQKTPLDVWLSRERTLTELFAACSKSPVCREQQGDLRERLDALATSFAGATRHVSYDDPRTGERRSVDLDFNAVLGALHAMTYVPERAAMLPAMIGRAGDGDFGPLFAALGSANAEVAEQISPALHFAISCGEDAARITADDLARIESLPSRPLAQAVLDACDAWPRPALPPDFAQPVASDVPALILSGGLDPVTPPENGETVAKELPQARHLVASGYGHIVTPHACAPELVAAFVERADASELPAACVAHLTASARPPLWPDRLGPRP